MRNSQANIYFSGIIHHDKIGLNLFSTKFNCTKFENISNGILYLPINTNYNKKI